LLLSSSQWNPLPLALTERRRAKRNRYRRNHRARNLLTRAVNDPSFRLELSQINTHLPVARIFLNSIQEDPRETPYLSPGTLPPSYTPIYEVEPDLTEVDPPSDPQLYSPPPSSLNEPSLNSPAPPPPLLDEPSPNSPPSPPSNVPLSNSPPPLSLLFLLRFIPLSILAISASRHSSPSFSLSTQVPSFQVVLP